mmetsp:Transcript_23805/g.75444  ORF Transcript_23805/g.75444 Transcript_23805/m.75444 type:complete len:570 (+) Transcript_23805:1-1710(+)
MANVAQGSWVVWFYAPGVYWVIAVTQYFIFRTTNRVFVPRRVDSLMRIPRLRATTVLVEGIPADKNSVAGLAAYFDSFVFDHKVVQDVHIVKDASALEPLMREREGLKLALHRKRQSENEAEVVRRLSEVEALLARYAAQIEGDDELNCSSAFVTFFQRREATVVLKLLSPDDEEEISALPAPAIVEVRWADLQSDPASQSARELIGYLLIAALFFLFLPLVVGISFITDLDNLQRWFPFVRPIVADWPVIADFWEGFVKPAALTIAMGIVPTALNCIATGCFTLRATSNAQQYLEFFTFGFQVVFVLLVTAIGSSLLSTSEELIRSPTRIFSLLAETMPVSTHFYMGYFLIQWSSHFVTLTRYLNLIKFFIYTRIYEPLEAKEMAEPEDQAAYGIGPRSALWTLLLVTALVFSALSPLMCAFGVVNFALTRIVFGYLFVFAETRKPDSGGVIFHMMLKQVQQGLFIYVALMTGVLLQRAETTTPGIISACAFAPLIYTYQKWKKIRWEFLEFAHVQEYDLRLRQGEVPDKDAVDMPDHGQLAYIQPELVAVEAAPKEPPPGFLERLRC